MCDFERMDADQLTAALEAKGRAASKGYRRMMALRLSDPAAAAAECFHGWGYGLAGSPAAINENDPRQGQDGWRCLHCGSHLSAAPWQNGDVLHPCEISPR